MLHFLNKRKQGKKKSKISFIRIVFSSLLNINKAKHLFPTSLLWMHAHLSSRETLITTNIPPPFSLSFSPSLSISHFIWRSELDNQHASTQKEDREPSHTTNKAKLSPLPLLSRSGREKREREEN